MIVFLSVQRQEYESTPSLWIMLLRVHYTDPLSSLGLYLPVATFVKIVRFLNSERKYQTLFVVIELSAYQSLFSTFNHLASLMLFFACFF